MKKLLLAATILCGAMSAQAAYSDFFRVETPQGEVIESGGTIVCATPGTVNGGFVNVYYEYDQYVYIRNLVDGPESFTCILTCGSSPTSEEYWEHYREYIPDTEQFVYGFAKMCNTQGVCYGDNYRNNLGEGEVRMKDNTDKAGFIFQLLNAPLDLTSEYKFTIYSNSHPRERFEANIVFAPSQEAADAFLGISPGEDDKNFKDFTITPSNNSELTELSTIEISSDNYSVSLNPDMTDAVINVDQRTVGSVATIPYDAITIENSVALITLPEPLTATADYVVKIPEGLFIFTSSSATYKLPATTLTYSVKPDTPFPALNIVPEAGNIESLSSFSIFIDSLVPTFKTDMYYKPIMGTLTLPGGEVVDVDPQNFTFILEDPDNFWSPIIGENYDLGTTYTEEGNYVLYIPAHIFFLEDNDTLENPDWTVIWNIGNTTGVANVFDNTDCFNVYDINGRSIFLNGTPDDLNRLPAGIYIINGKKVMIRK